MGLCSLPGLLSWRIEEEHSSSYEAATRDPDPLKVLWGYIGFYRGYMDLNPDPLKIPKNGPPPNVNPLLHWGN